MRNIDYGFIAQTIEVFEYHLSLSQGIKSSLKLSLQELLDNAFDHSQSKMGCYACVQSYPQAKRIRVAVTDFGIGMLASLRKNRSYKHIESDYEAIRLSVKEGVSRSRKNRGLGLSHIQSFLRVNQGDLTIISGFGKVRWDHKGGKILDQRMNMPFQGSAIELIINYDKDSFYYLSSESDYVF